MINQAIALRAAELKDLPVLLPFSFQTFHDSYAHLNEPSDFEVYMKKAFHPKKFENEMTNPNSEFWLAESGEELLGYLKVNFGEAQTDLNVDDGLEIERIYVHQKLQGKGLGKILIEKANEIASTADMKYIWLGVWDKNSRAMKFYMREGFEKFGTHAFQLGADAQTDILMRRFL